MASTREALAMWKKLVGKPKKQEAYIIVNGELCKITGITLEGNRKESKQ